MRQKPVLKRDRWSRLLSAAPLLQRRSLRAAASRRRTLRQQRRPAIVQLAGKTPAVSQQLTAQLTADCAGFPFPPVALGNLTLWRPCGHRRRPPCTRAFTWACHDSAPRRWLRITPSAWAPSPTSLLAAASHGHFLVAADPPVSQSLHCTALRSRLTNSSLPTTTHPAGRVVAEAEGRTSTRHWGCSRTPLFSLGSVRTFIHAA